MKVLVCTDGSSFSEEAVEYAGRLFKSRRAEVVVLRAVRPIAAEFEKYEEYMEVFKDDIHRLRKLGTPKSVHASLEKAVDILARYKIKAQVKTRDGTPADEIMKEVEEGAYDLIVVASYGRGISKFKLGSVSREVVHLAKVPVLVYKGKGGDIF